MARYRVYIKTEIKTQVAIIEAESEAQAVAEVNEWLPTDLTQEFELLLAMGNKLSIVSNPTMLTAELL